MTSLSMSLFPAVGDGDRTLAVPAFQGSYEVKVSSDGGAPQEVATVVANSILEQWKTESTWNEINLSSRWPL